MIGMTCTMTLTLLGCISTLVSAAEPGAKNDLALLVQSKPSATAFIAGNLQAVIKGAVEKKDLTLLDPTRILLAVGLGSREGPERIGELGILGSKAWLRGTGEEFETVQSVESPVAAAFALGLTKESRPSAIYHFRANTPVPFGRLLRTVASAAPSGRSRIYGVVCLGIFPRIDSHGYNPSLEGERPREPKEDPFLIPLPEAGNQFAIAFGFIVRPDVPPVGGMAKFSETIVPASLDGWAFNAEVLFAPTEGMNRDPKPWLDALRRLASRGRLTPQRVLGIVRSARFSQVARIEGKSRIAAAVIMIYPVSKMGNP